MATDHDDPDFEPHARLILRPIIARRARSSTAIVPARTNPTRGRCRKPTPCEARSPTSSTRLIATLTDTRLEADLADLLWSSVNLFHRKADRIERELDDNEQAQRRSQKEQDGSEVNSVELERLIAQGLTLIERRNAFEFFRDHAAELFESHTGTAWRPRAGSMVNHRTLTAAMIDSRDFLAARRRADTEVLLPAGPRIAFTGGIDCNDHAAIWARARQGARQASRHGAAARRQPARRRAHRRLLGRQPQGGADRLQARLDPARQRRAVQAQRPDARGPADRRRRLPRLRHLGEPRRQGQEARHPGLEVRRRVSAPALCNPAKARLQSR